MDLLPAGSLVLLSILFCVLQIPLAVSGFGFENKGASCKSNEYCPGGWSVLRRPHDYSAHTCNPAQRERAKCPKPHMCVAAKCGISFCCASDKMLAKVREQESAERDAKEVEAEDNAEKMGKDGEGKLGEGAPAEKKSIDAGGNNDRKDL